MFNSQKPIYNLFQHANPNCKSEEGRPFSGKYLSLGQSTRFKSTIEEDRRSRFGKSTILRDVREAGRGCVVPITSAFGGNDTVSSSHPLISRQRRICEIPSPAQSLTSKSSYYHQSPVNEGWWEGHLLQGLEAHLLFLFLIVEERSDCAIPWPHEFRTRQSPFGKGHQISTIPYPNLLKLAEIIFEQLSTRRDLTDGGRLPTSRDSSVAGNSFFENIHVSDRQSQMCKCSRRYEVYLLLLLLLLLWMPSSTVKVLMLLQHWMPNLLRLRGSWTAARYVNERQTQISKISRDELVSHIHASGNDFSASQPSISIFFNLEGRATSGKETRELQRKIVISLKELKLSTDCGSLTMPLQRLNLRYSSLHDNSQSCCCRSFSSSATKD
ncbi:hypothetical protein CUMW_210330 [Citrus unshiu]|uniref:Uncharacterized protein n=1 Tax=Citrus unshiu TaxID=55188 RepID=A0A2H5QA11_CITUN|nr:hypothetical protein CUMW_210330 [Citrus unshiu]